MKIRSALAVLLATLGAITLTAIPASASVEAYCGMVVTDPGTFVTLSADLDCTTPDAPATGPLPALMPAITIAASGVTVDLGGHTLIGHSYRDWSGIRVDGVESSKIVNGKISGYNYGIEVRNASGVTASHLDMRETSLRAVDVVNSDQVALSDLVMVGLNFWDVEEFFAGINVQNSHDVKVTRVTQSLSGAIGIEVRDSHDFVVSDSSFSKDDAEGIALFGTLSNGVIRNVMIDGSGTGVAMAGVPDPGAGVTSVALEDVSVSGLNGRGSVGPLNRGGVLMNQVNSVTADQVSVTDASYGFWVRNGSQNVTITQSEVRRSLTYGFGVSNPVGVTSTGLALRDNTAINNGTTGYTFSGVTVDSARNKASRNHLAGFQWLNDAHGSSTSDFAASNRGNGFFVNNPDKTPVAIVDAAATENGYSGLALYSGAVKVAGGDFSRNMLHGVIARNGTIQIDGVQAKGNGHSGVFLSAGSVGTASGITAVGNRYYGLAYLSGSSVTDLGGHSLSRNGIANLCRGVCLE